MTGKEIERIAEQLPKWKNGIPPQFTPEQNQLSEELNCRRMINSILCYSGSDNIISNIYLKKYIDILGIKIVNQLIKEQLDDFSRAIVKKDVYTDYEGCSYNSIIWADEQKGEENI